MAPSLDVVSRLNAAARETGAAQTVAQFDNIATHAQYRRVYEVTARYVHAGDRVLDWGCGNGHFSVFLDSLGARITGYSFEPRPRSMDGSPNFTFVPGSESDPRSLPFIDGSFDCAVSVGVLEHVWETGGDEPSSLAELSRVLGPGGTFLTFHLPNVGGWIEKVVHGLRLKKHFHQRKFDGPEIQRLWKDAGFEVVEVGLYNALPRAELRALPGLLKHSRAFTGFYDLIDDTVAAIAPSVCTNYFVVGRKL